MTGGYTGILTWTLVDLTFGVLTASLPVLVGLVPSAWRSVSNRGTSRSTRPTGSGGGDIGRGYLTNRSRATATGTRTRRGDDDDAESEDRGGILVEEEFELTYHEVEVVTTKDSSVVEEVKR